MKPASGLETCTKIYFLFIFNLVWIRIRNTSLFWLCNLMTSLWKPSIVVFHAKIIHTMRRRQNALRFHKWSSIIIHKSRVKWGCGYHAVTGPGPKHIFTGLPVRPSHKMGSRSSVSKSGLPGEGRHEGLAPRNDVLTNSFIWVSLPRSLARILFVPCLRSPWKTHKALRTWRRLFALFEAIRPWESL